MDLGGNRQQLLDALIDGLAVGPWDDDEHRVGREGARRVDGLPEIGAKLLGAEGPRRSRLDLRQRGGPDDLQAGVPRLMLAQELDDVAAWADEEHALCRHQ